MADTDLRWVADDVLTITLASLASDTNLLAGRESTAIVSSSQANVEDFLLSGRVTTGTSPTASKFIEIWAYAQIDDAPTYPDVMDGTDSNETLTSNDIKNVSLRLVAVIPTSATSNQGYDWGPVSLVGLYGELPERWGVFEVHDTGVNLNSTAGNHFVNAVPVFRNST